eukprot:PhM_4_TR14916/c0_g1_i1/m.13870
MSRFFQQSIDALAKGTKSMSDTIVKGSNIMALRAAFSQDDNSARVVTSTNDGVVHVNDFRVTVTDPTREGDRVLYTISLVHKKSEQVVHSEQKRYSEMEAATKSIRALHMRSNLPRMPESTMFTNRHDPAVIEERRKALQAFMSASMADPSVSRNPELLTLIGLKTLAEKVRSGVISLDDLEDSKNGLDTNAANSTGANNTGSGAAGGAEDDDFSEQALPGLSGEQREAIRTRFQGRTDTMRRPTMAPHLRAKLVECYNVMDADRSGMVELDEMQTFIDVFPTKPTSEEVLQLFKDADADNMDAIDPNGFMWMVEKLARSVRTTVEDLIEAFRLEKYVELFEEFELGSDGGPKNLMLFSEFSHLLQHLPAKFVTPQMGAVFVQRLKNKGHDIDSEEFRNLMERLIQEHPMPFDELYYAMKSWGEDARPSRSIVAPASANDGDLVFEDTFRFGGTSNSVCMGCETMHQTLTDLQSTVLKLKPFEARAAELESTVSAQSNEIAELKRQVEFLKARLLKTDEQIEDLEVENDRLRVEGKQREEDLLATVEGLKEELEDVETELLIERGKESGDTVDDVPNNFIAVLPHALSEHNQVLVLDEPGALYYKLDHARTPLKLTFDIYITDDLSGATEYIVCRDDKGRRSLTATVHDGELRVGLRNTPVPLKKNDWTRVNFNFHWTRKIVEISTNTHKSSDVAIEFRDVEAMDVSSLDIFPRTDAFVLYANMRFMI